MKTIQIQAPDQPCPLTCKAVTLLTARLAERFAVGVDDTAPYVLHLTIDTGAGEEGFVITDHPEGAMIVGDDGRGLLYGIGQFLRGCRGEGASFEPCRWRGRSAPQLPVRGIYFATHFHNFYHDAPLDQVRTYIEDLALWGCNSLGIWFDMHPYQGITDPAAQALIARLRELMQCAQSAGMGLCLLMLANEGYANSPQHLRADWRGGQNGYHRPPNGHYHVEICPATPEGMQAILDARRGVLEAFADLAVDTVCIWPYDQGGCTCAQCAPWGSNGFLKVSRAVAAMARTYFPQARRILSTWYFDHFAAGEWQGLGQFFDEQKPDWIDMLLIDNFGAFPAWPLEHGVPGNLPVVGFAEISMQSMFPWGGFGCNPQPAHRQEQWDRARHMMSGSYPYSEGIFEDVNKVIQLQLNWDPDRPTQEIIRMYCDDAFSPQTSDDAVRMFELFEQSLGHDLGYKLRWRLSAWHHWPDEHEPPAFGRTGLYCLRHPDKVKEAFALAQRIDGALPERRRQSWRWRICYLRAALDDALVQSQGDASDVAEAMFEELTRIYHAEQAYPSVAPPTVKSLIRLGGRLTTQPIESDGQTSAELPN